MFIIIFILLFLLYLVSLCMYFLIKDLEDDLKILSHQINVLDWEVNNEETLNKF